LRKILEKINPSKNLLSSANMFAKKRETSTSREDKLFKFSLINLFFLLGPISRQSSTTMSDRKAVIKNADMGEEMQQDAVDCATQALEKYNIEKVIVREIKKGISSRT
jgi:Dynein light chain type 1